MSNIEEIIEIEPDSSFYRDALNLRYDLFFRDCNLPFDILFDQKENNSYHLGIIHNNVLLAYGRLTKISRIRFQISQMVVKSEYQGQGFGSQILKKLISVSKDNKASIITLNARLSAIGLYEKFSFKISGKSFLSETTKVEHIKMNLQLK